MFRTLKVQKVIMLETITHIKVGVYPQGSKCKVMGTVLGAKRSSRMKLIRHETHGRSCEVVGTVQSA